MKYNLVEFSAIPAAAVCLCVCLSVSLPQSTATPISVLETSGYSVKVHTFDDAPNFMNERERESVREEVRERERESGNQQQQWATVLYVRTSAAAGL